LSLIDRGVFSVAGLSIRAILWDFARRFGDANRQTMTPDLR